MGLHQVRLEALGLGYPWDAARAADSAMSLGTTSLGLIDLGGLFGTWTGKRPEAFPGGAELAGDDWRRTGRFGFFIAAAITPAPQPLTEALGFDSTAAVLAELGEARLSRPAREARRPSGRL